MNNFSQSERDSRRESDLRSLRSKMLLAKERNNIRSGKGLEFSLTVDNVHWPERCPVLGMVLTYGGKGFNDSAASFDRIDNTKGYTPDNVRIMSNRANRLKNDGAAAEHQLIADYLNNL